MKEVKAFANKNSFTVSCDIPYNLEADVLIYDAHAYLKFEKYIEKSLDT